MIKDIGGLFLSRSSQTDSETNDEEPKIETRHSQNEKGKR